MFSVFDIAWYGLHCRSSRFDYGGDGGQKRNLDHKKAAQIERLGMGIGIGHVRYVFTN